MQNFSVLVWLFPKFYRAVSSFFFSDSLVLSSDRVNLTFTGLILFPYSYFISVYKYLMRLHNWFENWFRNLLLSEQNCKNTWCKLVMSIHPSVDIRQYVLQRKWWTSLNPMIWLSGDCSTEHTEVNPFISLRQFPYIFAHKTVLYVDILVVHVSGPSGKVVLTL